MYTIASAAINKNKNKNTNDNNNDNKKNKEKQNNNSNGAPDNWRSQLPEEAVPPPDSRQAIHAAVALGIH